MSLYRVVLAAIAAMGLATATFAADQQNAPAGQAADANQAPAVTVADASTADAQPAATPAAPAADASAAQPAAAAMDKVNINTASAKDLMKVKGMTAAKAKAIVAYRKKHGDFKSVDDVSSMKMFKKMKPEMMHKMMDQMTAG